MIYDLKLYSPRRIRERSNRYKMEVLVWDPQEGYVLVRFGDKDYQDYTQHGDDIRRQNYLTRSAGIRDGSGRLTKDNPMSANYWSRRVLWASGEPFSGLQRPSRPATLFDA